jgi:hypothetical protein
MAAMGRPLKRAMILIDQCRPCRLETGQLAFAALPDHRGCRVGLCSHGGRGQDGGLAETAVHRAIAARVHSVGTLFIQAGDGRATGHSGHICG